MKIIILNIKNIKRFKLLFATLILAILALLFFFFYKNKSGFYFELGNRFFGTHTLGLNLYNINIAEELYQLSAVESKENGTKSPEWLNYQRSRVSFVSGDLYDAIMYANTELRLYPDNCRTHYIRGLSYGYLEDLDRAIADFETFNLCFPYTWAGHNDLAWFWFRKGNMLKVKEVVEEVIKSYPDNPWLLNTYGTALLNLKEYAKAKEVLERAKKYSYKMTAQDWGVAYPGNNPKIYQEGLDSMRSTIDKNIKLIDSIILEK